MSPIIPETMQAVVLEKEGGPLVVRQVPVPVPGPGEVLVRMAASPINPSDLAFMKGAYGGRSQRPVVPGFEGSGTVVAAGRGLLPRLWLGKRVSCAVSATGGTWAQYLAVRATLCIPLQKNLSLEQGSMMLVNPLTALAFFDVARREKHAAIVNTAAASALGRMIVRLGIRYRVPVISIVRRSEQADALLSVGATHVLRSDDSDFGSRLRDLADRLNATLFLDAVGGALFQQLFSAAPFGSSFLLYANLSKEQLAFDPRGLGNANKRVAGFFLGNWASRRGIFRMLTDIRRIRRLGATDLQTTVQRRMPLSAAQQAVALSQDNPTAGKVLLVMDPGAVRTDGP
jgi:NADPH2:quinone reductase